MSKRELDVTMSQLAPILEECLGRGADVDFTPTGGSMRPLWRHRRDVVKLTAVDPERVKKWDVLLYKRSDTEFVLHRVIGITPQSFDFVGDAQFVIERGVPKEMAVAVVKGFCRDGGRYRTAEDVAYKLYVWLWCNSRGIRYFFYRVYCKMIKIFRRRK